VRAVSLAVVAACLCAAPATAATVSVEIVPPFDPAQYASRGAIGLFVPGVGPKTSRAEALKLLGVAPSAGPAAQDAITIRLALPPPGRHPNDRRYPIAIVGGQYHGLLLSGSTRIDGLVALADVEPTVRALERGEKPTIRARPDGDAAGHLRRLDRRIAAMSDARVGALLVLGFGVLAMCLLAPLVGTSRAGRAAVATGPAVLVASLVLSAAGVERKGLLIGLLAALTALGAVCAAALPARALPVLGLGFVVLYLVVLVGWSEVNSLAVIGPHVEDGGRFYGLTNLTSTILLAVVLGTAGVLGLRALAPIAVLALVTVGWSEAGADGGGLVVFACALAVLALRLSGRRLTVRVAVVAGLAAAALALALIGIDAASGGSSHVTRAVGDGPGEIAADWGDRLSASWTRFTGSWYTPVIVCVSLAALAWLVTRRPRFPAGDALVVGIVVSLLVNDHPSDVLAAGVLSYASLWTEARLRSSPARRLL
jgi:hypothetical protein